MKTEDAIREWIELKERELDVYPKSVTDFELRASIRALRWVIGEAVTP